MRDEDHGHAFLILQQFDELENFRLNRHIKCCCRLVGNQDMRTAGKADGNHHALPHAAGQLMRIVVETASGSRNAHPFEQAQGFPVGGLPIHAAMIHQRFTDLETDWQYRIEACHRLLKDHRDTIAAQCPHLVFRQGQQILAFKHNLALNATVDLRQQAHDGESSHAFTGARLAHHSQGFARGQIKIQRVDNRAPLAVHTKGGGQIADRKNGLIR